MNETQGIERLQGLLRELFQLDLAELDFGIYRLLHLKRKEVEAFLGRQLPEAVDKAFGAETRRDRADLEKQLEELAERIREDVAPDALLPTGEVNPSYSKIKILKEYDARRRQLEAVRVTETQKTDLFNHLYNFFSRYYDAGDFIPRRFYGSRESYAVPWDGGEILFHWANKNQHYVKTGEAFRDYAFTVQTVAGPYRVRFKLTEATTPKDNTKGDTRFFFPRPKEATYDAASKTFTLPFHYRLPTEGEAAKYGTRTKGQEAAISEAAGRILRAVPDDLLAAALAEVRVKHADDPGKREEVSLLIRRLRHFTKKNTTDYFIHKNLDGFLRRELEYYIKDQIIHEADLEGDFEAKRRILRVFRSLADQITKFLAQIEGAQKRLFEKKKFVLKTDYLIPIQNVPREFRAEILANKAQLAAWKELFAIEPKKDLFNPKGKVNEQFLKEHPTLVVNTEHFESEFVERLLTALPFQDLDEATDGLLIHSENYQALRLLQARFAEQIKCIYIDPPYNTGSDEFIYKDRYLHSSWLAMMETRLWWARKMLSREGAIFVSIDDNELANIRDLMDGVFGKENFIASVIWQKVYAPKSSAQHFSVDHDYMPVYARNHAVWRPSLLPRTVEADARYSNRDRDPRGRWKASDLSARNYYSLGQYEVKSPSGKKFGPPMGRYWTVPRERFIELDRDNRIWWGPKGNNMPALKRFLTEVKEGIVPETLWPYTEVGHTQEAKKELLSLVQFVRTEDVLNTVKPTRLIRRVLHIGTNRKNGDTVMDFFAGSGTTGDAVIRQNRDDGYMRRFILVEMGHYFHDMIRQRILRALYAPEWTDGKPKRIATKEEAERTPCLVKVVRLESYEDALHNLSGEKVMERVKAREDAHRRALGQEEYRIRYLLKLPLEASDTMLSIAKLEHPFDYTIEVLTDEGTKEQKVDLIETFNWLYGLRVKRMETWINDKDKVNGKSRRYRIVKATDRDRRRRILVVWRDMKDLDPGRERVFLERELKKAGSYDEIWINGDSGTPGFNSLDGLFKRLMEEGER